MRLLDRYLLRELLVPFGLCLSGFVLIWTMADWAMNGQDFKDHGLRTRDIFEYYGVSLPEFLVLLLPIALLLALLYALTHHGRHNEITAIRAAGVSMWRLAAPYLAVGLASGAVVFVLNEFFAPNTSEYKERIMRRRLGEKNPPDRNLIRFFGFTNARDKRTWQMDSYNQLTAEMTNVRVIWKLSDGSERWLYAARALPAELGWQFFNVREFQKPQGMNDLVPTLQTNLLTMAEFRETREALRGEVKISARLERLQHGKIGRAEVPIAEILDYLRFHPDLSRTDRSWLFTVLYGRLAAPWKCLVVVLIALPFGAASGRRNAFVGVASSIFICLAFYFLQEVFVALGTGDYVPAWVGGWFPNLLFGATGLWMTSRVR